MYYLIALFVFFILQLVYDHLLFKHRGRTKPDDPNDLNPPFVTGLEDARAQRLVDLAKQEKEKNER